jgi:tRNA dimethylallyltransferase
VHPNDRKRVARALELQRSGLDPPERFDALWTAAMRRPTLLAGIVCEPRVLADRIDRRVEAMAAAGAGEQARAAEGAGISRTARAALGFDAFLDGDLEAVKAAHRRYAKRQLTWLRKTPEAILLDRAGRGDRALAQELAARL